MRALLLMLVLAVQPAVAEEIYRTTDEDGNVMFTDEPPSEDAEPVTLDPLTTVPAQEPQVPAAENDTGDEGEAAVTAAYDGVRIAYPPADQAVRHNGGNVPVRVELLPEGVELADGHTVVVVLDGEEHGAGRGTEVTVGPLDRGPHRVRARILDRAGRVVAESRSTRFMLLREALGDQANPQSVTP